MPARRKYVEMYLRVRSIILSTHPTHFCVEPYLHSKRSAGTQKHKEAAATQCRACCHPSSHPHPTLSPSL